MHMCVVTLYDATYYKKTNAIPFHTLASMGKQWKKDVKLEASKKRGAQFTKVAREIQVAAKMGGPDPDMNSRLRMAIQAAKEVSCPKDTVERAIKKGAGLLDDGSQIEEVMYEGFGPHQVGVLVSCQTDNRARTVPEIRMLFKKNGGNMGEIGSVAWNFDRVSIIVGKKADVKDPEEDAIEAGANEVENVDGEHYFYGNPEDLDSIRNVLTERGWELTQAELGYKPKSLTDITEEQKKEVYELLQALEDYDDTHRIYASIK